jgi:hypothetical protein
MGSPKSLQTVMNTQIYNRNTHISGSEDRSQENSSIRSLGLYNQKIESQENSGMGGSLNLLVDGERKVSSLEDTFSKEKEGTNPKTFFCVSVVPFFCAGPYCTNPYSSYNTKKGMIFEAPFGTKIEADF